MGLCNERKFSTIQHSIGLWALILSVSIFAGCNLLSKKDSDSDSPRDEFPSDPSPVFTHHVTDLNDIKGIVPLGSVSANTISDHTYLFTEENADGEFIEVPVYAPTDMTLTEMSYSVSEGQNQYGLIFQVTKEVKLTIGHFDSPIQEIQDVGPDSPAANNDTRTSEPEERLEFEAGDLLGHTNGTEAGVWDIGLVNDTVENEFVNMDRYQDEDNYKSVHADCPFKYFENDIQAEYEALYALQNGEPYNGEVSCRSASRDVAGALSGAWYLDGEPQGEFSDGIAIARDFNGEIRIGGLGGGNLFIPTGFPDPAEINIGETVCYSDESADSFAYFELLSETEVNVAYGSGECPSVFPQGNTKIYYR